MSGAFTVEHRYDVGDYVRHEDGGGRAHFGYIRYIEATSGMHGPGVSWHYVIRQQDAKRNAYVGEKDVWLIEKGALLGEDR